MDAETTQMNERDLAERITLIEIMMQEGRRTTQHWGWNFVLWGIAYLVAVAWSSFLPAGHTMAWPAVMIFAALLTFYIARGRMQREPTTERSRAIQYVWMAVGFGIFVFAFPTVWTHHVESHAFIAAIETMLGIAHIASGSMLRWRTQIVVGALWWAAAIASCLVPDGNEVGFLFIAATLVCNIGFGSYLMVRESRERSRGGQVQHA